MYTIDSFVNRLKKIRVHIELLGNYPWVYLDSVNGKKVKEKYGGNHGFTLCILGYHGKIHWSDRKVIFKKIREMLDSEEGA